MIYSSVLETIGNTPHVRINRLYDARVSVCRCRHVALEDRLLPVDGSAATDSVTAEATSSSP